MTRTVVVDGSNIATEGRPLPSLRQLQDAVDAFRAEYPNDQLIIVADATFGHRIDPSEVPEFDLWVDHGQIVCPPAGAVGRGDAFVLSIAHKANATILSNDSFQEFHGTYGWLFDEGRLIGGKPVPHVGWVWVARTPVRGPISRKAVQTAKRKSKVGAAPARAAKVSAEAFQPMPKPKSPPPTRAKKVDQARPKPASSPPTEVVPAAAPPARGAPVNDLLPFLEFVERHPVGTRVAVTFDTYSSHGAYATSDGARIYVPLRSMADPAPRSAREAVRIGETREVVVTAFNAPRRGIDAAFPQMMDASLATDERLVSVPAEAPLVGEIPTEEAVEEAAAKRTRKRGGRSGRAAAAPVPVADVAPAPEIAPLPVKKRGGRSRRGAAEPVVVEPAPIAAPVAAPAAEPAPVERPAARSRGRKRAAPAVEPSPAPPVASAVPAAAPVKTAAKKSAKAPARKAAKRVIGPALPATAPPAVAPVVKAPAKKAAVKKAAVKKTAANKAAVKTAAAKKAPAKRATTPTGE